MHAICQLFCWKKKLLDPVLSCRIVWTLSFYWYYFPSGFWTGDIWLERVLWHLQDPCDTDKPQHQTWLLSSCTRGFIINNPCFSLPVNTPHSHYLHPGRERLDGDPVTDDFTIEVHHPRLIQLNCKGVFWIYKLFAYRLVLYPIVERMQSDFVNSCMFYSSIFLWRKNDSCHTNDSQLLKNDVFSRNKAHVIWR